jgi:WD40 repeat protein
VSIAASIRCLAYCAKTDTLVSGSFDQTLHVWRIPGPGKENSETKLLGKLLGTLCLPPNFALRRLPCVETLFAGVYAGHTSRIKSVAFSPGWAIRSPSPANLIVWCDRCRRCLRAVGR